MSITPRMAPRAVSRPTTANIGFHQYSHSRTVRRFQQLLGQHATSNNTRELGPRLLEFVADVRNLRTAWDYLAQQGGAAPGRNGLTYSDFATSEMITVLRDLREIILAGEYRPGPSKTVKIPKLSGKGTRTLTLQDIQDRVVARACVQILQPLMRPQFHRQEQTAFSNRVRLLAELERHAIDSEYGFVVKNDFRDAFDHLPQARLVQILPRYIPSGQLCHLIERCIATDSGRGLRQGSPLSPLMLDLYLDHALVRRWASQFSDIPLLKYVDDVLIVCQSAEGAACASAHLTRMVRSCGFSLKTEPNNAVLALAESIEWLGMQHQLADGEYSIVPGSRYWQSLASGLAEAQRRPNASVAAIQIIQGWLSQLGPCFEHMDHSTTFQRVREIAGIQGFDEIQSVEQLECDWSAAYRTWQTIRLDVVRGR